MAQSIDYESLENLPKVNGEEVIGSKDFEDYGERDISTAEIKTIVDRQYESVFGGS